jgi:HlyD family secretion protein
MENPLSPPASVGAPPIIAAGSPARKSRARRRFILISVVGLLLILSTAGVVIHKRTPPVAVQTEKIARRSITEIVVANGKVQPVTQVHISPEVSGEIIELPVKEGQQVKKGDLLLKIKPDFYMAALNQAKANFESSLAGKAQAAANLEKADAEFKRNKELFDHRLVSESEYISFKAAKDVAQAQLESATHQVEVARAAVDSARDSLQKTTIVSPLDGTISKLNSQVGERVLGTVQNAGTDIMIIADLNEMEARVDIGEMDVLLVKPGQHARLEVDSFKNRKFTGVVTDIANSSEGLYATSSSLGSSSGGQSTATQFEVRIRIHEKEFFRPGMTVTAEIETRSRTNVLTVPIASVTIRTVKKDRMAAADPSSTTNAAVSERKNETSKQGEVVFIVDGDHVKTAPVKRGISDENYYEITDGVNEGDEVVSGSYHAVGQVLQDGSRITRAAKDAGA